MNPKRVRPAPLVLRLGLTLLMTSMTPTNSPGQVSVGSGSVISSGGWTLTGTDPIEIRWAGEVVTAYQTGKEAAKPYFYPLIGPTGENVTRHFPMQEGVAGEATDHPHHRGLWFGFGRVNGLDFWHEPGSPGKEGTRFGRMVHTGLNGIQMKGAEKAIILKTTTDWVDFQTKAKVCQDRRTIRLERRDDGALVLDLAVAIEASEGEVVFGDSEEGGLALRVMPTLRLEGPVARGSIRNSEGVTGKEVWGKRARWVEYAGVDSRGRELGVAIFDHPASFRHPTWWHARPYGLFATGPFGQGRFEPGAAKGAGDHTLAKGQILTLRHRVLIHAGMAEPEALQGEFDRFASE